MNQWLPASLMKAICWTLVHSLWQGLILAAGAGLMMMLTKKRTAAFRYNMLAILFLVFMSVATGTFIVELNTKTPTGTVASYEFVDKTIDATHHEVFPLGTSLEANSGEDYIEKFTGYFNEHATLLVTIWFLVFMARALKLISGLAYIQRIRHYKTQQPAAPWGQRVKELADLLGVGAPVQLLESGLVTVPMVTGILKPIILVPAGLMANLPPEQVEAILLHELAHIRRRDFLVNLAQSFAETLFFFNPAVLWLSSLLRDEREHCCDDMAIGVTQSRKQYVHALVSFQEYQLENTTPYAMAFPGKKNQLLNRVRRIVNNSNKTLNLTEKTFLVVCIGLILLLSLVVTRPAIAQEATNHEQQLPDTLAPVERLAPDEPGSPVSPTTDPDQPAAEDGQAPMDAQATRKEPGVPDTIPAIAPYNAYREPYQEKVEPVNKANYITPYEPVNQAYTPYVSTYDRGDTMPVLHKANSVMSGVITLTWEGKEYKITVDHNRLVGLMVDGKLILNDAMPQYYNEVNAIFRNMEAEERMLKGEKVKENAAQAREKMAEASRLSDEQVRLHQQKTLLDNRDKEHPRLGSLDKVGGKLHAQDKLNLLKTDSLLKKSKTIDENPEIAGIIAELVAAGVATYANPLSFRINKDEVVVNNVKVPASLQSFFQDKYIKTPKDSYVYSKEGNRTSSTITIDR
ncbi:M56 family metallopeptidase [Paraflavitalea pollutisoli]|uniref:M56 family metallopeptidase n=1 Tax=Paraflavitalea pollutisoli TaxID=3034143 RepID=UPI0023EAC8A3|nr:M56 family metallopeptidase [Paraflavitalea sp. H1-2-19X]